MNNRIINRCSGHFMLVILAVVLLALMMPGRATGSDGEQDTTKTSFDLLMPPSSPAFILLGIEPSAVERPGTPSDLALTVTNHTDNFSTIPKNFAMDFAPYWTFFGNHISFRDFEADNVSSNFLQTLFLSFATSTDEDENQDTSTTSVAVGLKFSVLRGDFDTKFKKQLNEVKTDLDQWTMNFGRKFDDKKTADSALDDLEKKREAAVFGSLERREIMDKIDEREEVLKKELLAEMSEEKKALEKKIGQVRFRRTGWKMDIAAGASMDFVGNDFDNGDFKRWGLWFTFGREYAGLSALGVFRYLGNENDSDLSTLDVGGRLILDNSKKFSLSTEFVYRSFPNTDNDDEYRFAFEFDYSIGRSKTLAFTFGRDFEGRQSGNLLSMINFVMGFGTERPFR